MVTQRTNDLRRNRFENHVACTDLPTTRVNAPVQISATTPSMNDTSMTAGKANVSTLSSAPTHDLGPPVMAAREDTGTGGPKAKEFDLMVFLEGAKLLAHTEALKVGGYEEVPDLDEADDSDLMELGFKIKNPGLKHSDYQDLIALNLVLGTSSLPNLGKSISFNEPVG